MSVMASRPPNMPAGAGGGGPSKRPRLSLQIKTSCLSGSSCSSGNAALTSTSTPNRSRGFPLNPSDPTAFNTLSNAYVTAIERASTPLASPAAAEPLTAITTLQAISLYSPLGGRRPRPAAASAYPATPVSASSPRRQQQQQLRLLPSNSVMSPTPPVSAGAVEGGGKGRNSTVFSFSPRDAAAGRHSLEQALYAAAAVTIPASPAATIPASPAATPPKKQQQQQQQPARAGVSGSPPPYTHAKALRSILRNSPLSSRRSASSPRRLTTPTVRIQQEDAQQQQQQQQQRAAKRVCYHSPIEQEITTNTYTKSHIDLLVEEAATASPCSPRRMPVDLLRAFSANEIRDGGQTPGAFEDESKRLDAALSSSGDGVQKSSISSSSTGTTRGEKKRRWVWTIGREDEEVDEDEEQLGGAVVAAARAAAAAAAAASAAAGGSGSGSGGAPLLSVPTPKRKTDTDVADVEMAVMT
ncbi:hypothetical protein NHJ6243_006035 [Beauveria neobassiana]